MRSNKLLLLFIVIAAVPLCIGAYEKDNKTLSVGSSLTLYAPDTPDPAYPSLHYNTSWVIGGPIRKKSGGFSSLTIEATGSGTATVFCSAWYWNSNVIDHSELGYRHIIKEWTITCEGTGPVPNPDPDTDTTKPTIEIDPTNTFLLYDVITRSVNGVDMKFQVTGGDSNFGSAQLWGSFSEPSVNRTISGHLSIPEIIPNTSGYKIANFDNNGTLNYSSPLNGLKVKEIQRYAFHDCNQLTSIEIPASVESIFSLAFHGCSSLEEVTVLSSTPPSLAPDAFTNLSSFAILRIPKGSKEAYANSTWGEWFQYGLIREIVDPATLRDGDTFTSLSKGYDYMFQLMTFQVISTKEKTCRVGWYDSSNDYYGHALNEYDENGTYFPMSDSDTINIPTSVYGFTVTEISPKAFIGFSNIKSVSIPNTVKVIGEYSFWGCSLTSITIPSSITSIGEKAFDGTGITSVYIPDLSVWLKASLGYAVFDNKNKIQAYINGKEVKDLVIPNNISEIKNNAFYNFNGLTSVTIPNSVKSIGECAFYNCTDLKEIHTEIKQPFDIEENVFKKNLTFTNATLYVPAGTILDYKKRRGWTRFNDIIDPQPPTESIVTTLSSPIKQIAAGRVYSLALTEDGMLYGWGNNSDGQIGLSSELLYEKPTKVMGNVAKVTTNNDHTLIVKKDGTLWACGNNKYGQLGDDTENYHYTPIMMTSNVVAAVAGYNHTIVLKNDGTVWTCGHNSNGQLGGGETRAALEKVADDVVSIGAGAHTSYIIKKDGTLWGCGYNTDGALADGTTENRNGFVKITDNVSGVAEKTGSQLLVIKKDGTLWSAGKNHKGQLGDGTTTDRNKLKQVATDVVSVQGTWITSAVLTNDGTLLGCGSNQYGHFGDGTTNDALSLKTITDKVVNMALGIGHTLMVKTDGSLWVCGNGSYGQLGDGTLANRLKPIKVIEAPASTGVKPVLNDDVKANGGYYYDLQGRKVSQPTRKGLYIQNGKKFVK